MMWLLKLLFDQNLIIINYKPNGDLRITSFLEEYKSDTRETCNITLKILRSVREPKRIVWNFLQIDVSEFQPPLEFQPLIEFSF
jgi:hypothetical protein